MTASQAAAPTTARRVEDPYVGLTYFTEEYVDYFFGRDAESSLIIGNLRAARLTLLYAQSGVGKSSVLRAGVVARLRDFAEQDAAGRGSPRLVPVIFGSWSERPVAALVHAIGLAIRPFFPAGSAPELPADDLEAALAAASEALDATLLVILDQFEEHFLYPDEEAGEDRVAAQLARCVNRADLRANFLISIREDSYAELGDLFRGRLTNVYGNFLHLDYLGRAGGREAIERPIERRNESAPGEEPYRVEPALVDAVLDQVGRDEAGETIETTFLQLVMRRLWEEEREAGSRVLRAVTLERLGGAQAIIGSHLDRAMESGVDGGAGLSLAQRRVAASIFRFLVTSGGTKIALTTADLADLTGLPAAEIEPVVRHLSSPGLHILRPVVFEDGDGEPRFEIFHDALAEPIVRWRTRVKEEEREALARQEREDKEAAQRAAEDAERRARQERRRRQVAQGLLALVVLALLVVALVAYLHQQQVSEDRSATNESVRVAQRIAELAQAHAPAFGPAVAALAGVEDYKIQPTVEARNQELAPLQRNPGLPLIIAGHSRAVESVAYWPGSENLASAGADNTVRLWNPAGEEIGPSPLVARGHPLRVAVSRPLEGARLVAAGLETGNVDVWEIEGGELVAGFELRPGTPGASPVEGLAFSPRSPGLLAVGGAGVALWDLRGGHRGPHRDQPLAGAMEGLAFTPDGGRLLAVTSAGADSFAVQGTRLAGTPARLGVDHGSAVATGPGGLYAIGGDGWIKVWDGSRGPQLLPTVGRVGSLAFAPDGQVLVAGGEDWNVTSWDLANGRPFGPPRTGGQREIDAVAVSPDGSTIAGAGDDDLVRLWPLRARRTLATVVGGLSNGETSGGVSAIHGLAVGAGGRVAAAGGEAGTSIWSLRKQPTPGSAPEPLARIPGDTDAVAYAQDILVTGRGDSFAVYGTGKACPGGRGGPCLLATPAEAFSEEAVRSLVLKRYGSRLLLASTAVLGGRGFVNFWDLSRAAAGKIVHLPSTQPLETRLECLAFSPTHPLVAAGAADGRTRAWDVSDPGRPRGVTIEDAHADEEQAVDAVAFSRDGSLLASGGENQQVVFWKVDQKGAAVTVEETPATLLQGQPIRSLAFSPSGAALAVGDSAGTTCLYDVPTRHEIGSNGSCLLGHGTEQLEGGGIGAIKMARLGGQTVMLTAGGGQPIVAWSAILWNGSSRAPVAQRIADDVCALARQNLSENGWSSVFSATSLADDREPICPGYPMP